MADALLPLIFNAVGLSSLWVFIFQFAFRFCKPVMFLFHFLFILGPISFLQLPLISFDESSIASVKKSSIKVLICDKNISCCRDIEKKRSYASRINFILNYISFISKLTVGKISSDKMTYLHKPFTLITFLFSKLNLTKKIILYEFIM